MPIEAVMMPKRLDLLFVSSKAYCFIQGWLILHEESCVMHEINAVIWWKSIHVEYIPVISHVLPKSAYTWYLQNYLVCLYMAHFMQKNCVIDHKNAAECEQWGRVANIAVLRLYIYIIKIAILIKHAIGIFLTLCQIS